VFRKIATYGGITETMSMGHEAKNKNEPRLEKQKRINDNQRTTSLYAHENMFKKKEIIDSSQATTCVIDEPLSTMLMFR
jgi:hypothetical protein